MVNDRRRFLVIGARALAGASITWSGLAAAATPAIPAPKEKRLTPPRQLNLTNKPWTGDFDGMFKHRTIRVLVPYSRTLYFNDRGRERGVTADTVRDFERYINKTMA
ncbi:MAG TPA: lytic transglycosylase F, partial [Cupriavidus sp.]|nr:lytic transglycosylase F [Cupriavidus sp.]